MKPVRNQIVLGQVPDQVGLKQLHIDDRGLVTLVPESITFCMLLTSSSSSTENYLTVYVHGWTKFVGDVAWYTCVILGWHDYTCRCGICTLHVERSLLVKQSCIWSCSWFLYLNMFLFFLFSASRKSGWNWEYDECNIQRCFCSQIPVGVFTELHSQRMCACIENKVEPNIFNYHIMSCHCIKVDGCICFLFIPPLPPINRGRIKSNKSCPI